MSRKKPRFFHIVEITVPLDFTPTDGRQQPLEATITAVQKEGLTWDDAEQLAWSSNCGVMAGTKQAKRKTPPMWFALVPARDCPRVGDVVLMQFPVLRRADDDHVHPHIFVPKFVRQILFSENRGE